MAEMSLSEMVLVIHYRMVYLGVLICQVKMMPFVDWIEFLRILMFLSDFAVFVLVRNSAIGIRSVIMRSSVTTALPTSATDFVK